MNTENKTTEFSEKLLENAASWLAILDERRMDRVELMSFRTWLMESEQNRQAFEQVASLWGRMDVLQGLSDIIPIEETAFFKQPEENTFSASGAHKVAKGYWTGAIAASVLTAAVAIIMLGDGFSAGSEMIESAYVDTDFVTEVVTQIGQMESIDMEDGSRIVANTDSRLSVSETKNERRITLDKGEAFFEVEHDPNRPFDVVVDDIIVRAIGTAFSVYRDEDEVKVIVSEGIVEVIRPTEEGAEPDRDRLVPGQVASFGETGGEVVSVEQDELERKLFWRTGMLAFSGESLEEVVAEFGRYNEITFEIVSDEIRNERIGGYYKSNNVAGMLTYLQDSHGVEVTHISSSHVRLSAAAITEQ